MRKNINFLKTISYCSVCIVNAWVHMYINEAKTLSAQNIKEDEINCRLHRMLPNASTMSACVRHDDSFVAGPHESNIL